MTELVLLCADGVTFLASVVSGCAGLSGSHVSSFRLNGKMKHTPDDGVRYYGMDLESLSFIGQGAFGDVY